MKSSCYFVFNHSVLLCPNLYSTDLHNSLTAPNCTALLPIRFSTASVKVKVKVTLQLEVYRQSVRLGVKPLETYDQTFFFLGISLYSRGTDHTENTVLLLRNLTTDHREPSSHCCSLDCLQNCCLVTSCNIR
jgi:hypothetical protein